MDRERERGEGGERDGMGEKRGRMRLAREVRGRLCVTAMR